MLVLTLPYKITVINH